MSTGMSNSKWLFCISIFIEQPDRDWPKANHRTCRMPTQICELRSILPKMGKVKPNRVKTKYTNMPSIFYLLK